MKPRKTRNDTEKKSDLPCPSVVTPACIVRPWLICCWCLLTFVCNASINAQTFEPNQRFVGMLADGTRINADSVKEWHEDQARPQVAGRAIFDPKNPVRWLIDQSVPLAETPSAYIEMFGGDRLPCRVVDYQRSATWSYETSGEYLIVEPLVEVDFPGRVTTPFLRVSTRWLKRIVFEARSGVPSEWQPGTVFLHDGSRVAYRVVRWSAGGLALLTDSGVRKLLYSQVAELHLPRQNSWDVYFQQLAALTPDLSARLIRAETSEGIRVTVSTERFSAKHSGDRTKSENWYPLLHPVWSLDPITLPFRTIRSLTFFSPEQPPLLAFEPDATRTAPVFSTGWNWKLNLSVQSSVLKNNRQIAGWGFGVHAPTTLTFPLHPVIRQVRCRVGLDQLVGSGGCLRAAIALASRATQPFYRSDVLIGNEKTADSGWKNVTVAKGKSDNLLLIADPVYDKRPKGADPFDVRDCLNWMEPEWKLDKAQLLQEVTARVEERLPVIDGWTVGSVLPATVAGTDTTATPDDSVNAGLLIRNAWDRTAAEDERVRLLLKPSGPFVVFSQQRQIEQQHRWLALSMSRPAESTDSATAIVRVDGRVMLEADVPSRTSRLDPDPILVPVSDFQGRNALIEVVLLSSGEKSFVDWRGSSLGEHPPGIAPLFDESDELIQHLQEGEGQLSLTADDPQHGQYSLKLTSGDRASAQVPGFDFPIREYPKLGEYRYLRFVWKKESGSRIGLQLAYDQSIGVPDNEFGQQRPRAFPPAAGLALLRRQRANPRRQMSGANRGSQFGYQYDAGKADPVAPVMRLDRKLPEKWTLIQRDLFGEFGSFSVTGLGFQCSDEEPAFFDQIYLARQQSDFDWIDEVSGVVEKPASEDPNLIAETREPVRFGGLISRVAPQFSTSAVGEPVQLLGEYQGRKNVFRTLPPSKEKPCVLKAPVTIRKGKKTVLKIAAGRHPEGDWQLIVRANGQELFRSMVDANTAKEGWLDKDVDLSRFAGQSVVVDVLNEATGWKYEHAFWNRLEIVEQ